MTGLERAKLCVGAITFVAMIVADISVSAQPIVSPAPQTQPASTTTDAGDINLNFPDNVPLKTFVEYSASRLGLNIIYDEQILRQHFTIKSPTAVPESALRPLLESVLKMNGLAMVDGDQPNWKRIVALSSVAQPTTQSANLANANAVTQVFRLRHADPQRIEALIKPLLTTPGGSSASISEQGLLIVTDFQSVVQRIAELVRLVDAPAAGCGDRICAAEVCRCIATGGAGRPAHRCAAHEAGDFRRRREHLRGLRHAHESTGDHRRQGAGRAIQGDGHISRCSGHRRAKPGSLLQAGEYHGV